MAVFKTLIISEVGCWCTGICYIMLSGVCLKFSIIKFFKKKKIGEGNGNPLQYSCLEKSMDRGAWRAEVHGIT